MLGVDWEVHIGDLVMAGAFLISALGVFFSLRFAVADQGRRLTGVEVELKRLTDVLVANARLDAQVVAISARVLLLEQRRE